MPDFDFLVIGAGSGGVRAARMAAAQGKRVAIVERQFLGGTCVNVGCIPKKLFHYAAQYNEHFHEAAGFGWDVSPASFDWQTLVRNKDAEIQRLNRVYDNLLRNAGVTLIEGEGQLVSPTVVKVRDRTYSAEKLLIAVGSKPWMPEIPGIELAISSNEFFSLPQLPSSAVVVGGGYIAVELAGILHGLGVATTVVHRGERLLRGFDTDISHFLEMEMRKKGIGILLNENVSRVELSGESRAVQLNSGATIKTECLLFATGRKPSLEKLGLQNTRITVGTTGHITVDEHFQTAEPSIYAIGDVVGYKELTPVATAEAMYLVDHLFGAGIMAKVDYSKVASAVFSHPEIATVGLTQQQASGFVGDSDIQIYQSEFRPLKHTLSKNTAKTFMKIVVQKSTDQVLGIHMAGEDAGEIIQGFAVALQMGATKAQLDRTVGIHPTAAEELVTMRTPIS